MTVDQLTNALQNKMFGSRDTLEDAYAYAEMIAKGTESPMHVMTAVQVVVNTICNQLKECSDYVQDAE